MPNHDPLCQATVFKVFSINGGPPQLDCPDCALIARVREDAKGRSKQRIVDEARFNYERGLSAAREAVAATKYHGDKPLCRCGGCHANNTATAAIDALKEES
jgi:hypothetical protein